MHHHMKSAPSPTQAPLTPPLQILKYLVPVQLLLGVLPSAALLARYPQLAQYQPIMQARALVPPAHPPALGVVVCVCVCVMVVAAAVVCVCVCARVVMGGGSWASAAT